MTIETQGWGMLMFHIFSAHSKYLIVSQGRVIGGGTYFVGPPLFYLFIVMILTNLYGELGY